MYSAGTGETVPTSGVVGAMSWKDVASCLNGPTSDQVKLVFLSPTTHIDEKRQASLFTSASIRE